MVLIAKTLIIIVAAVVMLLVVVIVLVTEIVVLLIITRRCSIGNSSVSISDNSSIHCKMMFKTIITVKER